MHVFSDKAREFPTYGVRNRSNTIHTPSLSTWNSAGKLVKSRPHIFSFKSHYAQGVCTPCGKRIKFGTRVMKCKDCKAVCHAECHIQVPVPCIPVSNTPKGKQGQHHLTEYIPGNPPYIPAIVIHCIYAIECRGMKEVGLYRVPGSEREVKDLKEKFLRGKGPPCLSNLQDINVICGCLKDFLRNLSEPLITKAFWQEFVNAAGVRNKDPVSGTTLLYQLVERLPLANRDTLSFLMLHLQKVAAVNENKMPISNLATIFAPSIVGYSLPEPTPYSVLNDYHKQSLVVEQLLLLPTSFWNKYIDTDALVPIIKTPPRPISKANLIHPNANRDDNTPNKNKVGSSIRLPNKFFTSPKVTTPY
ncbi:rac GTPase-activating protein 1-like isoform X1 [Gordionus sp. m RMFG-2023]|uniref:rac GTPase-activating protein 1-like isoform X1 n=1 Tax=Gordionus sp. m RMFG-2023 TaxID=3053472 RepID=UPI0031FBF1B2